ncbi:zinc finger MYM-type protein 1-like [Aphis craccivora]|uniref:Zinc finger MYM-type protein 1-like n=1 Tax=Aphis craccivora TaxID=307492 RepID=A0A6G0XGR0_APHCR|nr:zinc finger MYM-type protein 1-like [Aphis craccivora]
MTSIDVKLIAGGVDDKFQLIAASLTALFNKAIVSSNFHIETQLRPYAILPFASIDKEHILFITALNISCPINTHCFTSSNISGRIFKTIMLLFCCKQKIVTHDKHIAENEILVPGILQKKKTMYHLTMNISYKMTKSIKRPLILDNNNLKQLVSCMKRLSCLFIGLSHESDGHSYMTFLIDCCQLIFNAKPYIFISDSNESVIHKYVYENISSNNNYVILFLLTLTNGDNESNVEFKTCLKLPLSKTEQPSSDTINDSKKEETRKSWVNLHWISCAGQLENLIIDFNLCNTLLSKVKSDPYPNPIIFILESIQTLKSKTQIVQLDPSQQIIPSSLCEAKIDSIFYLYLLFLNNQCFEISPSVLIPNVQVPIQMPDDNNCKLRADSIILNIDSYDGSDLENIEKFEKESDEKIMISNITVENNDSNLETKAWDIDAKGIFDLKMN